MFICINIGHFTAILKGQDSEYLVVPTHAIGHYTVTHSILELGFTSPFCNNKHPYYHPIQGLFLEYEIYAIWLSFISYIFKLDSTTLSTRYVFVSGCPLDHEPLPKRKNQVGCIFFISIIFHFLNLG